MENPVPVEIPESNEPGLKNPQESAPVPAGRPAWIAFLLELLQTVILAVVLYFLIDSVIARVRVENISMEPTLQPGELLLVNKLSYKLGSPNVGDIVVFHYPANPSEDFIKRVIGTPGDEVTVKDGVVFVNGQALSEGYIAASPSYNGSWQIPENSLFVLGDNRNQSLDSHSWGFVPMDLVVGKALVIYWPLEQIRVLSHPTVVKANN